MMAFKNLVGQPELRKALLTELEAGSVSPVTLLTGPGGSGKKSWGIALARALLCPVSSCRPCGVCLSCRQLNGGNNPNLFLIHPEGRWIKIDQIRRVRPRLYLASPEDECRVLLISGADRMTPEAGSSLLKLLEEPPERLYIILTSSHPEKLLSTIISRCRRYVLQLLSVDEITLLLNSEEILSGVEVGLIARLSHGLPGRARELAPDPALGERIKLAMELARDLVTPAVSAPDLFRRASSLAEREDLLFILELLYIYYRDLLLRLLCGPSDLHILPRPSSYPRVSPASLELSLEDISRAIKRIAFTNAHKQLALEAMIILLQRRFAGA